MSEVRATTIEIETQAADFLQRLNFWEWSEEDQAKLDAWLAESVHHRVAYSRLKANFARTDRLAALRGTAEEVAEPARRFPISPMMFRVAAAAVAIALIGG